MVAANLTHAGARRYQAVNRVVEVPEHREASLRARQRFLELHSVFELRDFLQGWFFGAPFETIRRENVKVRACGQLDSLYTLPVQLTLSCLLQELIAYGFHTRRLDQLNAEVGPTPVLTSTHLWTEAS